MSNQNIYESLDVVSYYEKYGSLQPPEKQILELLQKKLGTLKMLDIGIGGGRTTVHFAPLVKEYTGIDYSAGMINACRKRFEGKLQNASFSHCDARNMQEFEDSSFDLVLFSFNGIDYVTSEDRKKILAEIHRVTRKNGLFIFSSHNLFYMMQLRAFQFRLNILACIKRFFEVRKIKHINKKQLALASAADHLFINDGAHNFSLETFYGKPAYQVSQLSALGFTDITLFSYTTGEVFNPADERLSGKEKWFYYLCRKG